MRTILVHEVIDHGRGVIGAQRNGRQASLCHLFFDSKEDADAYVARFTSPIRRAECQYIHRAWGLEQLTKLWIEDHRKH